MFFRNLSRFIWHLESISIWYKSMKGIPLQNAYSSFSAWRTCAIVISSCNSNRMAKVNLDNRLRTCSRICPLKMGIHMSIHVFHSCAFQLLSSARGLTRRFVPLQTLTLAHLCSTTSLAAKKIGLPDKHRTQKM